MKQKIRKSSFPIYLGLCFMLVSVSLSLPAQERRDSLRISQERMQTPENIFQPSSPELLPEKTAIGTFSSSGQMESLPDISVKRNLYLPYHTNPSPIFRGDYDINGIVKQFRHGIMFGSGGQTSLPGIGRFNEASLGYRHALSQKLALQFSVNAMKINMPHITGQTFSASGALLYHPSERITFKLFGSYDIGNSYGMSTHTYGATVAVDMSERFSMEMGVQRYYDAMRGRWETVPVVIPSYRFKKFKLGLDVGGVLYEIIRRFVTDKEGGGRNGGTIAPPRFPIPIR